MKLIIFKINFTALKILGLQSLHLVETETKRVYKLESVQNDHNLHNLVTWRTFNVNKTFNLRPTSRSSRSQMLFKSGVFAIFT